MADDYTNTAEHRIPVPAITDQWNFTREITNLRTRLNKGLAGTAAYNVDGTNYVLAAANAGALLSRGGGYPRGSVIGAASGQDPYVTLYTNTGAALVGEWSIGADDSDTDKLMFSTGVDLSAPKMTLTEGGALGIGTSTPATALDVAGTITCDAGDFGEGNITNVGDVALDSITADGTTITIGGTPNIVITNGTTLAVNMGVDAGDDLNLVNGSLVVEGDTGRVGIATATPGAHVHIKTGTGTTSGLRIETTNLTSSFYEGGAQDFAMGTTTAHVVEIITNTAVVSLFSTDRGLFMSNGNAGAPAARANMAGIYSQDVAALAELFGIDEAGNTPQLTPHDPVTGEAYLRSTNLYTGKQQTIWHERIARVVEQCAKALGIAHDSLLEITWTPDAKRLTWMNDEPEPAFFKAHRVEERAVPSS